MSGKDIPVLIFILMVFSIPATAYIFTGNSNVKIRPIWYVIGILLAPLTIVAAILRWLFFYRA